VSCESLIVGTAGGREERRRRAPRSICSLAYINIPNLCDNFVKKVVSEIKESRQLQGALPLDPIGGSTPNPRYVICPPLAEGMDPPLA